MTYRKLFRGVFVMVVLSVLAACSIATLAYNNAGILIGYALDDYVELTPPQELWLKDRVDTLIAWHRNNELPEWQRWLIETRERAGGRPQTGDVQSTYASGRALLARTTEQMLPDMVQLLRQLEATQVSFLERKFARDNRKLMEDIAMPTMKRKAHRIARTRERFESWLGGLTPEQAAFLESRVEMLTPLDEMRLADRERWQRQFIELIRARPELTAMQEALRRLILAPERSRDPAYQAELTRQQEEMMAITAWMVSHATPAQKARLQKKISGYAADIAGLLRT